MTPEEEYAELVGAFEHAAALSINDRNAYLEDLGQRQPGLRQRLEVMLRCDEQHANDQDEAEEGLVEHAAVDSGRLPTLPHSGSVVRDRPARAASVPGYELVEELGRGGMGVVFRARQEHPRRVVALKMIRSGKFASDLDLQRFIAEAETTANLDHDGIVPIYEVGQCDGEPFYTMKFVDGDGLDRHLAEGAMTRDAMLSLLISVCRAIAHCHERGVVHRDLKPSNILIDSSGQPRVTDFGLAKFANGDATLTVAGDILGTPGYMPPEQAMGDSRQVGPAADVYALGAILYHMLTGRPPIHADDVNVAGAVRMIREHDVVRPREVDRHVPKALDTVCMKCLETNPQDRYQSAGELADELERIREGEPIRAEPPSFMRMLTRRARHQPGLAVTWIGLLVFFVYHLVCYYVLAWPELTPTFHFVSTSVVLAWAVGAWACQRGLLLSGGKTVFLYLWATLDTLLVTLLLSFGDGAESDLVVLYHVLIAGAILRFKAPLVSYVTAMAVLGYTSQIIRAAVWQPELLPTASKAIPFVLSLLTLGLVQHLALRRTRAAYDAMRGVAAPENNPANEK